MGIPRNSGIIKTEIPGLKLAGRGKVRDIYDLGPELLVVATDRISCFDVVLPTPIPGKGAVLTRMANFWFSKTGHIIENHLSPNSLEKAFGDRNSYNELKGQAVLVKKCQPLPIEAIVRGYITGSGWNDYQKTGRICGLKLPEGLQESEKFPEPLYTPSSKAEAGEHDENISYEKTVDLVGAELAAQVKEASLKLYQYASRYARSRGIIVADTKFEFGLLEGRLILIDEVLTPDSSRFWPLEGYRPGCSQPSYDKQFVRDYLLKIKWDKSSPPPELPEEIVTKTVSKYQEALKKLTS